MFEYIQGTLTESAPHKITIDVNGLGYLVFITISTFEKLPQIGSKTKIYLSTIYREDSQKSYGFLNKEERDFFETLIEISGIGPRLAMAILGHMRMEDLYLAVEHSNVKAITQIPGIGKKMAERLVLELKDKYKKWDKQKLSGISASQHPTVVADAISALIHLGYPALDAQKAVQNALDAQEQEPSLPQLISLALKK